MWKKSISLSLAVAILVTFPVIAGACGKERWAVKVVEDKDKGRVDDTPVPTKISRLIAIDAPENPTVKSNNRYATTELTTYEITGTLTLIKPEDDGDYHMVIKDDQGHSMIIESADPTCAKNSRFANEIAEVRNAIDQEMGGPVQTKKTLRRVVTVTGIGFFDRIHGQTGVAPNGIELHPVLSMAFHKESSVSQYRTRVRSMKRDSVE